MSLHALSIYRITFCLSLFLLATVEQKHDSDEERREHGLLSASLGCHSRPMQTLQKNMEIVPGNKTMQETRAASCGDTNTSVTLKSDIPNHDWAAGHRQISVSCITKLWLHFFFLLHFADSFLCGGSRHRARSTFLQSILVNAFIGTFHIPAQLWVLVLAHGSTTIHLEACVWSQNSK